MLARNDLEDYTIEVHAERFHTSLKVYFSGPNPTIETDPFNLDIIVRDLLKRSFQKGGQRDETVNTLSA